jgi:hypothetical protein
MKMNKLIKISCLCAFAIFSKTVNSQILTIDRENGQDSIQKKIRASFVLNFSSDKQKNNIVDFTNKSEIDFFTKKNQVLIVLAQTELAFNGKNSLEKNGNLQIRFRDNDTRVAYPEAYIQYQWNGILGMEQRKVAGLNIRVNCIEKRASDLYLSVGTFYENERWNPQTSSMNFNLNNRSIINREMFRLNTVAKFAFKIAKGVDFSGVSYLQFPLNENFKSPRWYFDSNINFEVNKHLSFLIQYDHNLDNYRPLPIDNYYYSLSLGLSIRN